MSLGTLLTERWHDDEAVDHVGLGEAGEQHTGLLFAAVSDLVGIEWVDWRVDRVGFLEVVSGCIHRWTDSLSGWPGLLGGVIRKLIF